MYGFVGSNPIGHWDYLGNEPSSNTITWNDLSNLYNRAQELINDAQKCMKSVSDALDLKNTGNSDKLNHCLASCNIANDCSLEISYGLGVIKEARDVSVGGFEQLLESVIPESWHDWVSSYLQGGSYEESVNDFEANLKGYTCMNSPDGCECCCKKTYD